MHRFAALFFAFAMFCLARPAWAEFRLCNDTSQTHHVAFTQKIDNAWNSQGWWPVPAGDCVTLVEQDLTSRFFYLRLRDVGASLADVTVKFCASDQDFHGLGAAQCQQQRLLPLDFQRIDVGRGTAAFTQQISALLSQDDLSEHTQRTVEAVFGSCRVAPGANVPLCSFVGQNRQILAYIGDTVPKSVARRLLAMPTGASVRMTVRVMHDTINALEVDVLEVSRLAPDAEHQLLMDLEGTWVSKRDRNDSFTVHGPFRTNFYLGAATTRELLWVSMRCLDYPAVEGYTLHAWSKDDTQGLCYQIERLTDDTLELRFLPSGRTLEYVRKPNGS